MDRSSFSQEFVVKRSPRFNAREAAKIGKWRKIEAILDQQRLQQELQQFDFSFDIEELAASGT